MAKPRRIPVHMCSVFSPDGTVRQITKVPVGRLKDRNCCKYCHEIHSYWWRMRFDDYGAEVVLCGRCGHTTELQYMEPALVEE